MLRNCNWGLGSIKGYWYLVGRPRNQSKKCSLIKVNNILLEGGSILRILKIPKAFLTQAK